jgi:hypothetical protein
VEDAEEADEAEEEVEETEVVGGEEQVAGAGDAVELAEEVRTATGRRKRRSSPRRASSQLV